MWRTVLAENVQPVYLLEQNFCLPTWLELPFTLVTCSVLSYRAWLSFWTEYHLKKCGWVFAYTIYCKLQGNSTIWNNHPPLFFSCFSCKFPYSWEMFWSGCWHFLRCRGDLGKALSGLDDGGLYLPGRRQWTYHLHLQKYVFRSACYRCGQALFSGFLERTVIWDHVQHPFHQHANIWMSRKNL